MVVQCPFCGLDWTESALLIDAPFPEGGQCDCGAWWFAGMDDVEESG